VFGGKEPLFMTFAVDTKRCISILSDKWYSILVCSMTINWSPKVEVVEKQTHFQPYDYDAAKLKGIGVGISILSVCQQRKFLNFG